MIKHPVIKRSYDSEGCKWSPVSAAALGGPSLADLRSARCVLKLGSAALGKYSDQRTNTEMISKDLS